MVYPCLGPWLCLLLPGAALKALGHRGCCHCPRFIVQGHYGHCFSSYGAKKSWGGASRPPRLQLLESRYRSASHVPPRPGTVPGTGISKIASCAHSAHVILPSLTTAAWAGVGPKTQAETIRVQGILNRRGVSVGGACMDGQTKLGMRRP